MRGSPLLRAALMVAALLALLVPLRSLTTARATPSGTAPAAPTPTEAAEAAKNPAVRLRLDATATPFTFSVAHLGRVIWSGDASASPVETTVALPFPPEGVDLALEVTWAAGRTGAVRLAVARDENEEDQAAAQTAWGDGAVHEIFTFR